MKASANFNIYILLYRTHFDIKKTTILIDRIPTSVLNWGRTVFEKNANLKMSIVLSSTILNFPIPVLKGQHPILKHLKGISQQTFYHILYSCCTEPVQLVPTQYRSGTVMFAGICAAFDFMLQNLIVRQRYM